ncbi:MAG: hypothetical protein GVY30_12195 [Chloroflexi bacterium]|nr:hypothetical protein [Chloroflexota bacterium]
MLNDQIENRVIAVASCIPHPQNYNRHSPEQIGDLRASLRKFGQVRSVVVQDDGAGGHMMVAGHGILEAAKAEGLENLRADVIPQNWPPVKVLAYLAADNELGKAADPDQEQLAALVASVKEEDEDLALLAAGGDDALASLLSMVEEPAEIPLDDKDVIAELSDRWGVLPGDVWVCDDGFAVACGDCRDVAVWDRLLETAGASAVQIAVTSPPYAQQRAKQYGGIEASKYVAWWKDVQACVRKNLSQDGSFFVNIKPHVDGGQRSLYVMELVMSMVQQWGWCYIDEFVWVHQGYPGAYVGRYKNQFEPVYQFSLLDGEVTPLTAEESFSVHHFAQQSAAQISFNPEGVLRELGDRHYKKLRKRHEGETLFQDGYEQESGMGNFKYYKNLKGARPGNVIHANIGAICGKYKQAATFPIGVPAFFIRAFTDEGDVVIDPFCGSGTTLAAAHRHGRVGLGIEKETKYTAVILERLFDLGLNPRRVITGEVLDGE